ncbi:MAG: sigma-54-dependent Fis family transcriptional regulator [bacterium]|nr:sigma-54-dependent Fis family transcriptional regulator [bacterium]
MIEKQCPRVLVVDDEPHMRSLLQEIICDAGYECDVSENGEKALQMIINQSYDLVISDVKMPRMQGIELLQHVKKTAPRCAVLIITAFGQLKQAVEAIKIGAENYITKPFDPEELLTIMHGIFTKLGLTANNIKHDPLAAIIGEEENIKEVKRLIYAVAPTNSTVLIQGESGTGKELVAQALYQLSKRNSEPFVKVNCAAIPSNLMESELFGHAKGSFTGAFKDKPGKFELADKGTIYLDEIGDMELSLQAKILRVLQEKELNRVGSESEKIIDVRVIAATNKDLTEEMHKGNFREDLYYRLNVITIKVPPLRERKNDLPALIDFFRTKYCGELSKPVTSVSQEAMDVLMNHSWPGNIRELQNVIEHAVVFASNGAIQRQDLPDHIFSVSRSVPKENTFFKDARENYEKHLLENALTQTGGKLSATARLLGISRHSLRYQMEKFGVDKPK